ncbi:hypothetical protein EZS27_028069 [termite gut metagenome]|uniref:Uncharacterized protein n=1 Tax=termite gut metagenome TaxID=433724 RepID=A0A5J4QN26_9ZZZZ
MSLVYGNRVVYGGVSVFLNFVGELYEKTVFVVDMLCF